MSAMVKSEMEFCGAISEAEKPEPKKNPRIPAPLVSATFRTFSLEGRSVLSRSVTKSFCAQYRFCASAFLAAAWRLLVDPGA